MLKWQISQMKEVPGNRFLDSSCGQSSFSELVVQAGLVSVLRIAKLSSLPQAWRFTCRLLQRYAPCSSDALTGPPGVGEEREQRVSRFS
jgi:hypothetical protein